MKESNPQTPFAFSCADPVSGASPGLVMKDGEAEPNITPSPELPVSLSGMVRGEKRARYVVRGQRVGETKTQLAKELRRQMTPAERILWERLRGNRLGYHFRRQQVIEGYIADFYCHVAALVVEVDGPVHDYQADYDERRTTAFALRGIHVMRFRNNAVVTDTESVVLSITAACAERGAEPNPPAPFPKKEGGADPEPEGFTPSSTPVLSPSLLRGGVGEGLL
ncbi:Restriction endonuclease like protein OS=Anabaena sp. 90 GN=ANA_C20072 PE=4 SV=1: DUF559 [Gemmata massiliana]|uniref:DUF559 domain-containing protein n=1 Tax=Gemmata massiliana TaxID=1210884 RepID=A0A6P2D5X2_9BACT|nr:endonuclease domain-containing protein [Gemmata massiliana]VTR95845.1 Restriction endonuclease like protein OS=Anabaena sp. 90 GN=ANA_C20072 PE=4 SV=1: DUF559 [Gemmata massiliana]